jgi:hypothetical protein
LGFGEKRSSVIRGLASWVRWKLLVMHRYDPRLQLMAINP